MKVVVESDDLITSTMLADELNLTRPQVSNWIKRHDSFPAPVLVVGTTIRLYSRAACYHWVKVYLTEQVLPAVRVLGAIKEGDPE